MYSEKQKQLLRLFKQKELRRINILHGSVRSGKTWISLVLWAFWMLTMPEDAAYLMVAKTLTSLRRNCLDLLETNFSRERDNAFIQNLTDSVTRFEYRSRKQAEALERARLLNEQAERLKKEANRLAKP